MSSFIISNLNIPRGRYEQKWDLVVNVIEKKENEVKKKENVSENKMKVKIRCEWIKTLVLSFVINIFLILFKCNFSIILDSYFLMDLFWMHCQCRFFYTVFFT